MVLAGSPRAHTPYAYPGYDLAPDAGSGAIGAEHRHLTTQGRDPARNFPDMSFDAAKIGRVPGRHHEDP
jgi:hypothetical protein